MYLFRSVGRAKLLSRRYDLRRAMSADALGNILLSV